MKGDGAKDPSILTKDRLKAILTSNGIVLPNGDQRKDVYVKLYLQHIQDVEPDVPNKDRNAKSEFSSDDDRETTSKARRRKSIRKKKDVDDKNSGIDVDSLSDEELLKSLKKYDSAIGPVIDTTRNLYKRKLKSYILKSNTAESQEFSDQDGTITDTTKKEVKKSSTPRRGRAKGRKSISRNEVVGPEVSDSAGTATQKDVVDAPNASPTSVPSQQSVESVQKQDSQETSLWYFIIILVMILAIFTGALIKKINPSSSS